MLVTFETIAQASQNVQRTYQNLTQKLDDLHSFLAPMVAEWTGSASEQYQQKQQQWNQAQQDLGQVLQAIGRVLEETHSSYQQTEQANTSAWG
ncbi:WXG100 family type VII secretion target [Actinocrinis sp.]|uniref:WXG100 family type VII secretion target n=1 Tax=Actinocrinis sp. TaxID=1920516 RepID=UPI002DDCF015|nr:WXG100 family type VII secretion target [Actinocrinis sp.]